MHMKKSTKRICSLVLIALAVVLLFILDGHKNEQGMLISILQKSAILAIVAVAMNLLNGFTGLFSLGQAGFMSIGAYVTAILMIPVASLDGVYYMNGVAPGIRSMKEAMEAGPAWLQAAYPFLALIAGGLIAAAFAALIGIPVLRLKSDYLAIATLGFSEIIRAVFSSPQMDTITNGSYGLNKVPTFPKLFGLPVLFTPFIIAAVCIALMVLLINSTYGRAFKAIREDEIAAEAMGVNLFKHKQLGFQHLHGLILVLELGTLILAGHHSSRGKMGDTDRRRSLVDVLSACAAGAVGINTDIIRINLYINILLNVRHDIAGHKGCLALARRVKG